MHAALFCVANNIDTYLFGKIQELNQNNLSTRLEKRYKKSNGLSRNISSGSNPDSRAYILPENFPLLFNSNPDAKKFFPGKLLGNTLKEKPFPQPQKRTPWGISGFSHLIYLYPLYQATCMRFLRQINFNEFSRHFPRKTALALQARTR